MSTNAQNAMAVTESAEAHWKGLYRLGGVTALVAVALFFSDVVVMTTGVPMAASAGDWFALMQSNPGAGILELFFTDLFGLVLLIPFVLGLYGALRPVNPAYAALAAAAALLGIGVVIATNPNYALLYLNSQYTAATTEMQKAQILATGESQFTAGMWGSGYLMAGLLIEGALAAASALMLRSASFGRGIAWLGITAHGLDLLHSVALLALIPVLGPDAANAVGVPLLIVGGTLQLVWYPLAARKLLQLAAAKSRPNEAG